MEYLGSKLPIQQRCCKCGSNDITTVYKEKGYRYSEWGLPHSYDVNFIINFITVKELLHKRCSECGYSWVMDTLDYKSDGEVQYPNKYKDPVTILLKGNAC